MAKMIIRSDFQYDGKGQELFAIHEEGKEQYAFTMGLGKARKLHAAIMQDPEAFFDVLAGYIGERESAIEQANTPLKTLNYNDVEFGLFADNVVKMYSMGEKRSYWRAIPAKYAALITPEAFDNPESLVVPVKLPKATRTSTSAEMAEMKATLQAQAAQTAQLQAMLAQLLTAQTVKA